MKKTLLSSLLAMLVATAANASDGGVYQETETITSRVRYNTTVATVAVQPQCGYIANVNCAMRTPRAVAVSSAPVRVKTHTEVIDHYRLYRPVVTYVPAGNYSERRIVRNSCNG